MFTKEIKPIISEQDYSDLRKLYTRKGLAFTGGLIRQFILNLRHHYTMVKVAKFLGISRRQTYRMLNPKFHEILTRRDKLNYLIVHIFYSVNYDDFIRLCLKDGIIVSKGD